MLISTGKIEFIGYEIEATGVKPGSARSWLLKTTRGPKLLLTRQSIGQVEFFRYFVEGYAVICRPLAKLTKKQKGFNGRIIRMMLSRR